MLFSKFYQEYLQNYPYFAYSLISNVHFVYPKTSEVFWFLEAY